MNIDHFYIQFEIQNVRILLTRVLLLTGATFFLFLFTRKHFNSLSVPFCLLFWVGLYISMSMNKLIWSLQAGGCRTRSFVSRHKIFPLNKVRFNRLLSYACSEPLLVLPRQSRSKSNQTLSLLTELSRCS